MLLLVKQNLMHRHHVIITLCIVKVIVRKRDLIFSFFNQKSFVQSIRTGRVLVLMVGLRLELLGTNIYWEFMALYVSQQLKSAFSILSP